MTEREREKHEANKKETGDEHEHLYFPSAGVHWRWATSMFRPTKEVVCQKLEKLVHSNPGQSFQK